MKTAISWSGILYHSNEHCLIDYNNDGIHVTSMIAGCYNNDIYRIEYTLELNINWQVMHVHIQSQVNGQQQFITAKRLGKQWFINDEKTDVYNNIDYVDISLTPFTNTLPVNGLPLKLNEQKTIDVLYFDLLQKQTRLMKQQYTKLGDTYYLYENYDNSFKAEITVDEKGFVTQYPGLFKMN